MYSQGVSSMSTRTECQAPRGLAWEGCLNARELGGYPTKDGRATHWSTIIRSNTLWYLTPTGQQAVVAAGVRFILDLRMPKEAERYPNPFAIAGTHGIGSACISVIDPAVPAPDVPSLADEYKHMLDSFSERVVAALAEIAHAPPGGVLIHCTAGKDRTGLIAALLLDLTGVARETIAADYALSAECLRERDMEWLEHGLASASSASGCWRT